MKKLTIGYVLDDTLDKPDGVQQAVISIGEHMRHLGHEVHYLVADTKRTDLENIHSMARVISLKFNGNSTRTPLFSSKKLINKVLNEIDFDVLHIQMPYSPLMAGRVVRAANKETKIVGTFHILPYNWLSRIGTRLLGLWLIRSKKYFDKVYAVSAPALEFMNRDFGIKGEVLPNPVDYSFFNSHAVTNNQDVKSIVFVGRFDKRKGVGQLVKAFEQLPSEIKNTVTMTMCGKGPLRNELVNYSNEKRLNIKFPGFITDEQKAGYLAKSDIAIFPSTGGESFGIVLIEAMSAGAGITLGGDNPGYSSVLGFLPYTLFNSAGPDAIADKIRDVVTNNEKRLEIGALQHETVKQYDIKLIAIRLINDAYTKL